MATKVFISWSGELSKKLAEALRDWLPAALQFVKPYFTPDDIEKGTKWHSEIAKELGSCDVGIMCLTRDNLEKPWLLFEAGALSKSFEKSRVCPLLFGLDDADIKGPLEMLQRTKFVRDDFKRLLITINQASEKEKLETKVLDSVFDKWWPDLEKTVDGIMSSRKKGGAAVHRSDRDILEEILGLCRASARGVTAIGDVHLAPAYLHLNAIPTVDYPVTPGGRKWGFYMNELGQQIFGPVGEPDSDEVDDSDKDGRRGHKRGLKKLKKESGTKE